MMPAEFATVGRAAGQRVEFGGFATLRAVPDAPVAQIHDVLKAYVIVREPIEKRLDRELCHEPSPTVGIAYGNALRVSRGYIPVINVT
jgi:hypothetical protein